MVRGYGRYAGGRKGNKPSEQEKRAIAETCESLIADLWKPRYLPEIRPTSFNYCIDIFGKWHGGNYRFIQRYRCDDLELAIEPEFDAAFARLEYVGPDRFNLAYFRHTGQWWTVFRALPLAEALSLLETENILHPVC